MKSEDTLDTDEESDAEIIDKLTTWTHEFGASLCPGSKPNTSGEGVRSAKDAVSRILRGTS